MKCIIPRPSLLHPSLQHHPNSNYSSLSKFHQHTQFLRHPPQQSLSVNAHAAPALLSTLALVLADVAQPKGDINVFLQTGGLMFSAYLLANFVVPSIVMKQLQSDESADNNGNKSVMEEKMNEEPKKNRGFNSTKP
ncbi:unnamed protein product [Rhodiola kirilowii]